MSSHAQCRHYMFERGALGTLVTFHRFSGRFRVLIVSEQEKHINTKGFNGFTSEGGVVERVPGTGAGIGAASVLRAGGLRGKCA